MKEDIPKIPGIHENRNEQEADTGKMYEDSYFRGLFQNFIISVPGSILIISVLYYTFQQDSSFGDGIGRAFAGIAVFMGMVSAAVGLTIVVAVINMFFFGLRRQKKAFRANLFLAIIMALLALSIFKSIQ